MLPRPIVLLDSRQFWEKEAQLEHSCYYSFLPVFLFFLRVRFPVAWLIRLLHSNTLLNFNRQSNLRNEKKKKRERITSVSDVVLDIRDETWDGDLKQNSEIKPLWATSNDLLTCTKSSVVFLFVQGRKRSQSLTKNTLSWSVRRMSTWFWRPASWIYRSYFRTQPRLIKRFSLSWRLDGAC